MRRILLYMVLVLIALRIPVQGIDVGKLRPVQVIALYNDHGCVIETDTGDKGKGKNAAEALEDLKKTTPAIIYLDTADFLIVGTGAEENLNELRNTLKKDVRLCKSENKVDLQKAAEFLKIHRDLPQLKVWNSSENLPILEQFEERLKILKNNEKSS